MTEKMKPSGMTWIGDIPQDWDIKRIEYLTSLKGRIGWQGLTSDEYIDEGPYLITGIDFQNGGINWNNCVHISEERWAEAPEIHIQNGDLLITKDGTVGKVAIVSGLEGKASLNSGVLLIRTEPDFDKRFLFWVLQSEEFWTWFRLKNVGNSTIIHLYQGDFAEFSYTFPNVTEQCAIADFLDAQCTKIDSVIADIEKQIETLQKYKKSLITEAVTKGLDQSVPMKDSGIVWVGEIPMHWDICRIKDTCSLARGGSPRPINEYLSDNPNDLNWIRIGDTVKGSKYIIRTEQKIIKSGLSNSRLVHKGDLLLTNSMSFGQPYILKITGCIHDGWLVFSDYCGVDKLFLYYALMSELCYIQFKTSVAGAVVENLNIDKVGASKIFVPPIEEQERIVKYLDAKCEIIDEILLEKEEQLETMKQHKKSLIYEYVTGKKRVAEVN